MDNFEVGTMAISKQLFWSTKIEVIMALAGAGGALGTAAIVLIPDTPGRLLVSLAALVALGMAAVGLRNRPQLAVIGHGKSCALTGQRVFHSYFFTCEQLETISLIRYQRLGRTVSFMEITGTDSSGDSQFIILNWWNLGVAPEEVYTQLRALGSIPKKIFSN
ncbi:MAG: PH domain-containing protein [Mycobacteriaceae bacterium]